MSLAISSSLPAETITANVSTHSAPAPVAQPPAQVAGDTVQLTVAQQVYQLYNQGQQVSQIASSLKLSVEAVNGFLNIAGVKL